MGTAEVSESAVADEVGRELVRMMRLLHRAKSHWTKLLPGRLDPAAVPILFRLVDEGPQRTSALAAALHTDVSAISRQTSAMVQEGFIERQADPADGRACLLAPTQAGHDLFVTARRLRNEWLRATLKDWSDDDTAKLIELLGRLNSDLATDTELQAADTTTEGKTA